MELVAIVIGIALVEYLVFTMRCGAMRWPMQTNSANAAGVDWRR